MFAATAKSCRVVLAIIALFCLFQIVHDIHSIAVSLAVIASPVR